MCIRDRICIRHAKICETVLRYKTTIQNSFKNQRLIPLTIGVKKASSRKSCQASEVRISCEDQLFCELQYRDRLFVWSFRSNDRLNTFFVKQLLDRRHAFPSTSHERASLIQFTSLKLSQSASALFFSTRNSKEPTRELRNSTRDSILEIFEDRESSRVLRLASDSQLTFEWYCSLTPRIYLVINNTKSSQFIWKFRHVMKKSWKFL